MYIKTLPSDIMLEWVSPIEYFKDDIKYCLYKSIVSNGYIKLPNLKHALYSIKIEIITTLLIIILLLPLFTIIMCIFTAVIIPYNFIVTNPSHVFRILVLLNGWGIYIQMMWWVYNNKLGNCVYLHILGTILLSFYENRETCIDMDIEFNYYITQASKEWDYYDKIRKL